MKIIHLFLLPLLWLSACADRAACWAEFPADAPEIGYVGRTAGDGGGVSFDWAGTTVRCRFTGSRLAVRVSDTQKNYYRVTVDGEETTIATFGTDSLVVLAEGLGRGEHFATLLKRTEGDQGRTTIHAFLLDGDGTLLPAPEPRRRHIEFIGNSLTCGYGVEGAAKTDPFLPETENCYYSFASIIARVFDAECTLISHSGRGVARNYGDRNSTSEETMPDRMLRTFDEAPEPLWDFAASPYRPDLVVINLGSNDFSTRPHPSREEFRVGYLRMLGALREHYGERMPILCVAPYTHGPAFAYIEELVREAPWPNLGFAALLPGYYAETTDLGAVGHPNRIGQRKMAMALIPYVSSLTGWELPARAVE